MATIRVGISGWAYPGWRGRFYPPGLIQRHELQYAAERFTSIEINGSFYSLQRPSSYSSWHDQAPDGFVFAVKGGRYITHMKRLAGAETALALGRKLGPVLWQLPPNLAFEPDRLRRFFAVLPRTTQEAAQLAAHHDDKLPGDRALTATPVDLPMRHALEVRHQSFASAEAVSLLRDHDVALVVADTAGTWPLLEHQTADFSYVRLHGSTELYASGYSPMELDRWAERSRRDAAAGLDVYVYFDNDAKGHGPFDALGLLERVGTT